VEQANFDAVHRLVQRLVIVNASEAVVAQMFTSFDQAVAARTAVTDLIDLHVEEASDDTYPALVALHAALVAAVPGDSATLPKLQPYTPVTTVPSLVLAHQLYGHLDREADLVTRNRVRHPGFVTGGVGLEVLDG
jgi:prophage DNA circulation protein